MSDTSVENQPATPKTPTASKKKMPAEATGSRPAQQAKQAMATKEDLMAIIQAQQETINDLEDQIAQRDAVLAQGDEGWIVSVPNPQYNGRTAGVQFEMGHAFIPKRHPDAERLLNVLTNDFGYSVTETMSGHEVPEPEGDNRRYIEKISQPHRV